MQSMINATSRCSKQQWKSPKECALDSKLLNYTIHYTIPIALQVPSEKLCPAIPSSLVLGDWWRLFIRPRQHPATTASPFLSLSLDWSRSWRPWPTCANGSFLDGSATRTSRAFLDGSTGAVTVTPFVSAFFSTWYKSLLEDMGAPIYPKITVRPHPKIATVYVKETAEISRFQNTECL